MNLRWHIQLLGELRAASGDAVVTRFPTAKTALLLAYLAYHRERPHRREELIDLLWPAVDPAAGRNSLRQTLHLLRQQMEPPGLPTGAVLVADRASIALNPAAFQTDVAEFETALQSAAQTASRSERVSWLARAADLYRGELLTGYHDDWVLQERAWLAERYFQSLRQLIALLEAGEARLSGEADSAGGRAPGGDLTRALAYARQGVRADALREEAHGELMRLYAAAGQPAAALRQYRELERRLRDELGAAPTAGTRALAREIERLSAGPSPHPATRHSGSPAHRKATSETETQPAIGRNRLVTLLVADLRRPVGTTSTGRLETGTDRLAASVVDILLRYEAGAERFLDSALVAVFGTSMAHEDDAERAIRAALEIREAAQKLGLEITAGIQTATASVETTDGERNAEGIVAGPALDQATRLNDQAQPGQILVGEITYRLSRQAFEFAAAAPSFPGAVSPEEAYAVRGALPRPRKTRGIEGLRAALIGRDEELARLKAVLVEVVQGRGQMVSLIGEAGVGKSRLVAELKGLLAEVGVPHWSGSPPLWLEGRCLELGMSSGYSLFVDLFRDFFAWRPGEDEGERARRLLACLQALVDQGDLPAERMEEIGPLLGHVLSIRFGDDWDLRLKHAGPEQVRHQTLVGVRDFFLALARRQPAVLVLEDLHWADPHSLDLIALLMEALPQAPLLLLCVCRPEREHRSSRLGALASRKCRDQFTELTVRELTAQQSSRLVDSLLGVEDLPASVKMPVLEKSCGNPFFVEEVVRSLIDAGIFYRAGGSWRAREAGEPQRPSAASPALGVPWAGEPRIREGEGLPPSRRQGPGPGGREADSGGGRAPGAATAVPEGVQSVILSRVDRLAPGTKRVLESACVMGRLFRRRLLQSTVREPEDLEAALGDLEERGLIYQERVVPEEEFSFQHVLTQETVYQSLPSHQRGILHQQVGEAIEALYRQELDAYTEQLAYHYERSEVDEKAVEYLLKAGERARYNYLNEEAIGYFQRALARLDRPSGGVPVTYLSSTSAQRLEAFRGLGQTYLGIGKVPEAQEALREAIAVGREIGLAPRELVRLYSWYGDALWWGARCDEMIRLGEEGLELLGENSESVEAALMNDTIAMGHADSPQGDPEKWREYTYRNARFLDRLPYLEDLRAPYTHVSYAYQRDKNFGEARRWLQVLEAQAKRHHDLRALSDVHRFTMDLTLAEGDLPGSLIEIQQALALMTKIGDAKHECICLGLLGRVLLAAGDLSSAEESASRMRDTSEAVGSKHGSGIAHYHMGVVSLCRGALDRAVEAFERVARIDQELGRAEIMTALSLGRAYLARGEKEAAQRQFEAAAALAETGAAIAAALSGLEEVRGEAEELRASWPPVREEHGEVGKPALTCPFLQPTVPTSFDLRADEDPSVALMASPGTWRDPFGDGAWLRVPNGLQISAPNGRDLAFMNVSAPRLVQPACDEFAIQTVCGPVSPERPAIGGLLLWKDSQNYLRLDRGTRGPYEISFSGCVSSRDLVIGRGRLPAEGVFLRLERVGCRVNALCSADGQNWFTVGHVTFAVEDPVEVGLHAIGAINRTIYHGAYPDGTAIRFESCQVWR